MPAFYKNFPGAVLTTAIDKYVYITVNKNFDSSIRLKYSEVEEVEQLSQIKHHLIRQSLELMGITSQIEITSLADIPVKGTGLGSSSSYLVGVLNALHAYKKKNSSPEILAQESSRIEMDVLRRPVGKQDHYIAAYGGLNLIKFMQDGSVIVEPVEIPEHARAKLQEQLHMFYTGISRDTSDILSVQTKNFETGGQYYASMERMVELAHNMAEDLGQGKIEKFGEMLHENWELKKQMAHNISNAQIDAWYEAALNAGATGGKILGAGGGGFLLLNIPPEKYEAVKKVLHPLEELPFNFEPKGSVIFNMQEF